MRSFFRVTARTFTLLITLALCSSLLTTTAVGQKKRGGARIESAQPEAVYSNPNPITIVDATETAGLAIPYPSTIAVSGLPGDIAATPGNVKVTIHGLSHTFPEDIGIVLVGPTGAGFLLQDAAGGSADINGVTYTLSETAASDLPDVIAWAPGTYQPASYEPNGTIFPSPGPGTNYTYPGPFQPATGTLASTFGGTNPNGNWNLFVADFGNMDTGTISGGWTLEIDTDAVGDAVVDMNGDGKTDYAIVRLTGGQGDPVEWWVGFNGGGHVAASWGLGLDEFIPGDYDGDDKDDFAIWRPVDEPIFCAFLSLDSTVRCEQFGLSGDDPVIGDYNNDGKDDIAVYRQGFGAGEQSFWFYRTSPGGAPGNFETIFWGITGDLAAPGDYDGDGRNDFVIFRDDGSGNAVFWKLMATGEIGVEIFGFFSDRVAPGDYDGDNKTDLCVIRNSDGRMLWMYEPSGTPGQSLAGAFWGFDDVDDPVPGDYDGDGRTDFAIWRPGSGTELSTFWVLRSSDLQAQTFVWGLPEDVAVGTYNIR